MRISLQGFLADASESQVRAWDDSIPRIQVEVGEVVEIDKLAEQYTAILEYELPLESRRPDVVLLISGAVVVIELKGKADAEQADLDQAACLRPRPALLPQALRRAGGARRRGPHAGARVRGCARWRAHRRSSASG